MRAKGDSVVALCWWCVVGAGFASGVLAVFTIGPFVLLATLMLSGVLLWRLDFGWGMAGILLGSSLPLLLVAWGNRAGPGTHCRSDALSTRCDQELSPWPFLVVGLALAMAGIVVFLRGRRS